MSGGLDSRYLVGFLSPGGPEVFDSVSLATRRRKGTVMRSTQPTLVRELAENGDLLVEGCSHHWRALPVAAGGAMNASVRDEDLKQGQTLRTDGDQRTSPWQGLGIVIGMLLGPRVSATGGVRILRRAPPGRAICTPVLIREQADQGAEAHDRQAGDGPECQADAGLPGHGRTLGRPRGCAARGSGATTFDNLHGLRAAVPG